MNITKNSKRALERASEIAGSQTALANRLTKVMGRLVKQQNIHRFLTNKGPVNPEFAIPIEKVTHGKVNRHEVAPHIYPQEAA